MKKPGPWLNEPSLVWRTSAGRLRTKTAPSWLTEDQRELWTELLRNAPKDILRRTDWAHVRALRRATVPLPSKRCSPDELFGGHASACTILLAHLAIADVVLDDLGDGDGIPLVKVVRTLLYRG